MVDFNCEGQNEGNNGEIMMYNYGLDHKKLRGQLLVLTIIKVGLNKYLFHIQTIFMVCYNHVLYMVILLCHSTSNAYQPYHNRYGRRMA